MQNICPTLCKENISMRLQRKFHTNTSKEIVLSVPAKSRLTSAVLGITKVSDHHLNEE
jgi:hypothetical protein